MLKLNDIMKMVDAGFTAAQIQELIKMEQPEDAQAAQPEDAQAAQPEDTIAREAVDAAINDKIDRLTENIDKLGQLVIMNNINSSNMPQSETVDDILAQVINPKIDDKGVM